jgi:hypothetical protein
MNGRPMPVLRFRIMIRHSYGFGNLLGGYRFCQRSMVTARKVTHGGE